MEKKANESLGLVNKTLTVFQCGGATRFCNPTLQDDDVAIQSMLKCIFSLIFYLHMNKCIAEYEQKEG